MNRGSESPRRLQPLRTKLRAVAHDSILDAAEQVFGEEGLDAGMEAIAARAGVAVGTLYNHFADRRALVEALSDARRAKILEGLEAAALASARKGFEKRLEALLGALANMSGQHVRFRKLLFDAGFLTSSKQRQETRQHMAPIFESLFAAGVKEGVLRAGDHQVRLAHLLGLFKASFDVALKSPETLPLSRLPHVVADAFLHGAGKRSRS